MSGAAITLGLLSPIFIVFIGQWLLVMLEMRLVRKFRLSKTVK